MAGKIPQQFIDELISRVDIVDIINTRLPLRKAGRDFMAVCPFHDEKSPSFSVSQEKQFYYCFGCGASGSAISFLMEYEHMDFVEAVHNLASFVNLTVPVDAAADDRPKADYKNLYDILGKVALFYQQQLRHDTAAQAVEYLKGRGLSGEAAVRFGVGFAPSGWDTLLSHFNNDAASVKLLEQSGMLVKKEKGGYYDRFRNRIMFPIHDPRGRVIGFGGRATDDSKPKYLNSPETPVFQKGQELYGLHQVKKSHEKLTRMLVVEGYMDVIGLAQYGVNYAVATLGTATTRQHLERLFRLVSEVVFCFDGDRAGREAAWRALEIVLPMMQDGRQAKFMFLPEKEDPDSYIRAAGKADFEAMIVNSVPLSQFLYGKLEEQADINTIDGRSRLVELARPLIEKIPGKVFHYMMIEQLGEKVHMEAEKLSSLIGERTNKKEEPVKRQSGELSGREERGRERLKDTPKGKNPSLVRKAIRLLLEQPSIAQDISDINGIRALNMPGIDLLVQMIELLNKRTEFTSGNLIEHWRGTEEGRALEKLLSWQPEMLNVSLEIEFSDTIKLLNERMIKQQQQQARQRLESKPFAEWSAEEKLNYSKSLRSE
jgi:DNA primase